MYILFTRSFKVTEAQQVSFASNSDAAVIMIDFLTLYQRYSKPMGQYETSSNKAPPVIEPGSRGLELSMLMMSYGLRPCRQNDLSRLCIMTLSPKTIVV